MKPFDPRTDDLDVIPWPRNEFMVKRRGHAFGLLVKRYVRRKRAYCVFTGATTKRCFETLEDATAFAGEWLYDPKNRK